MNNSYRMQFDSALNPVTNIFSRFIHLTEPLYHPVFCDSNSNQIECRTQSECRKVDTTIFLYALIA